MATRSDYFGDYVVGDYINGLSGTNYTGPEGGQPMRQDSPFFSWQTDDWTSPQVKERIFSGVMGDPTLADRYANAYTGAGESLSGRGYYDTATKPASNDSFFSDMKDPLKFAAIASSLAYGGNYLFGEGGFFAGADPFLDTALPGGAFEGFGGFSGPYGGFSSFDPSSLIAESGAAAPSSAAASGPLDFFSSISSKFAPGEIAGIPEEVWERLKKLRGGGGMLSAGMDLVSGIYGLKKSRDLENLAAQAANPVVVDPFGYGPRNQYASELSALRADPTRIESLPGYKAGLNAVERKMASQGYLGSGNMMAALQQYGGQAYDSEIARLAQLSGATQAPIVTNARQTQISGAAAGADLASRALASLGYAARRF